MFDRSNMLFKYKNTMKEMVKYDINILNRYYIKAKY